MGSFNMRGFASHISIKAGDPVVVILGLAKSETESLDRYYTCGDKYPLSLPIYGTYDDYGNIEVNYKKNPKHIKWLEEHIGDIHDIIEAFGECHQYTRTIKEALDSDNEYHPETKVRYVYSNLIEKCKLLENSLPFYVMEHEEFYKKAAKKTGIIKDYNGSNDVDLDIQEIQTGPEEVFNKVKEVTTPEEMPTVLEKLSALYKNRFSVHHTCIFGSNAYRNLKIYEIDTDFYCSQKKQIKELQSFIYFLIFNSLEFNTPVQYNQDMGYKESIKYHQMCIDLAKRLKKEQDEEY